MPNITRLLSITVFATSLLGEALPAQPTCGGDCNDDAVVAIDELIVGVNINLGRAGIASCPAMDTNADGRVVVNELVSAVDNSLRGCNRVDDATFADVQQIFDKRCTFPRCHGTGFIAGGLDLEEGASFDQIVGVTPLNPAANVAGLLRIDPGDPANSLLVVKVAGTPPEGFGRQMPLGGTLSETEVGTIRTWVENGAKP